MCKPFDSIDKLDQILPWFKSALIGFHKVKCTWIRSNSMRIDRLFDMHFNSLYIFYRQLKFIHFELLV